MRSDAHVAIRSGKAMLISAWERLRASDGHLARDEYLQLMQECVELFKSLGDYAGQHQAWRPIRSRTTLMTTVKGWPNSRRWRRIVGASMAAIGITAPAGISIATPKTVTTHAGGNVDIVAQNHLQYTSGQRINLQAGHGVAMFAHSEGVSAIANQGRWRCRARTTIRRSIPRKHPDDGGGGKLAAWPASRSCS